MMLEHDLNDDMNVTIEVRPGSGGDEAGLWAGDVCRMLTLYAERRGFKTETLSLDGGACTFAVLGEGAYGVFKFEDGVHRAKRVPVTETLGRVHTATAAVVVQIIEAGPRELALEGPTQVSREDRRVKIRTYSYGEGRVKDHRLNLVLDNLEEILMGELDALTDALRDDEGRGRL